MDKRCPRCGLTQPTTQFHKNRRNADGLTAYCKTCAIELAAEQRERAIAARTASDTKHCTRCDQTKAVGEFHHDRRSRDGLAHYCKECNKAKTRAWAQANPDRVRAQAQKRTAEGRNRSSQIWRKYGLTSEAYEALLTSQGGVCAICKTADPGRGNRYFHVDHCHASNRVRGLLCNNCNRGIGLLQDSGAVLRQAADYIDNLPAE